MILTQCRGSIAGAAVVVALLCSRPAAAQVVGAPGPHQPPRGSFSGLGTGIQYDILNQAKAERRLQFVESKLRRDLARGKTAAADFDARWLDYVKYRMAVNVWLIRKNSLQDPGYYPVRTDPISCAAIAEAARPPDAYIPAQSSPDH